MMKPKERGIQARVLFVALAPVVVTAIALTLYFTLLRYNDVEEALRQRGVAMTHQLVAATQYGLFSGNNVELNRLVQALSHEPDVSAITLYSQSGQPLAATGKSSSTSSVFDLPDNWIGRSKNGGVFLFHNKVFAASLAFDDPYAAKPTTQAPGLLLGSVTIELSRNGLVARRKEILLFTLCAAFLILVAAGLIARRLGRDISEPVLALESFVGKIRGGLLTVRIQPHPAGTLRMLEEGINTMAAALELAQKRSTEALTSSNTQLQQQSDFANALVDAQSNAGVSLIVIEDGRISHANQAALDLAGRSLDELAQGTASEALCVNDKNSFERHYLQAQQGEPSSSLFEISLTTPDGIERWSEFAAFRIHRGKKHQVVMLGTDITQRKRDAQQLLKAHEILRAQKEEAERASAAKSRFLAAASHDLRQPLHALSLFSSQLQERFTTPTQSRLASQIEAAIGNMSQLLESLLDISRIDLSTLPPDIRSIELAPLLAQIAATHRHAAESKSLRLSVAPTSLRIASDPRYLSRIVSNLVSNAVRYTERGRILIGARRKGEDVRIEVWDTGIGIHEQHFPSLFQEFYQVANPERDASKGLGLGLSIVDRLAGILHHKIGMRSTLGVGSVFSVDVPRARTETAKPASMPEQETSARILLAVRDEVLYEELAAMLCRWGYSVLSCPAENPWGSGSGDAQPDLILCDRAGIPGRGSIATAVPMICIVEEGGQTSGLCADSSLSVPVKPARLRALILHLLAEN